MSKTDDVVAFCNKFGIPLNEYPGMTDTLLLLQRVGLIGEEKIELRGAVDQLAIRPTQEALVDFLDASVDLCYAVMATCASMGLDFDEAWRRVHAANMAKERATSTDNKRGSTFDVIKPQGWTPPVLDDLCGEPTLEDLLCETNGSNSVPASQIAASITSTVELERLFRESGGVFRRWETTCDSKTSGIRATSSDNLSETILSQIHGELPRNYGARDYHNANMDPSPSTVTDTSSREERKAS